MIFIRIVLEFLTAEVDNPFDLTSDLLHFFSRELIWSLLKIGCWRHIQLAMANDEVLSKLLETATIANGTIFIRINRLKRLGYGRKIFNFRV